MWPSIIVPWSLNTDIIGKGVSHMLWKGEYTNGWTLLIGPWWKSRNIAQMIAMLSEPWKVAMIGITSSDPYGLRKIPYDALQEHGVCMEYVKIYPFEKTHKYPGIALIPVDRQGNNQIYVLPWISDDFPPSHIHEARALFEQAKYLALTMEMPTETALEAIDMAHQYKLKVIFDPGGINTGEDYSKFLSEKIFLIKPNKHETTMLTCIHVVDKKSAQQAGDIFLSQWIQHILITLWWKWAYFINRHDCSHIPISNNITWKFKDETWCGDQTLASIITLLSQWYDLQKAVKIAIKSWTMQFYRPGIQPLKKEDLQTLLIQSRSEVTENPGPQTES